MKTSVSNNKRIALAAIIFLPAIFLLVLPYYRPEELPYFFLMLGRFHPVILHFPIVLIILAMILEFLHRKHILKPNYVVTIILSAAAISTLVAIASGFLLYASGDYSGSLLRQHLWIGVITGVCILSTVALYFLYRHAARFYPFYIAALLVSNASVAYTSHLGGALTHGEDYLTEYLPMIISKTDKDKEKPESEMKVYEDMILPVFEAKCISCHNDSKSKGEFNMVTYQGIVKGGESGNAGIIPGNADSSEVYSRVILPEDHDDRMPPKGKTELTLPEAALMKFWIQSGAGIDMHVQDARKDTIINAMVDHILPDLKRYRRKQQIAKLRDQQLRRSLDTVATQLNISIEKDTTDDDDHYLLAMKFPPARFTNDQFRELAPYAEVFSKVSLVSSGIEDDGLYHIGHMVNLKQLFLQKTNLDGSGLIYLKNLEKLEVLNLSFTKVDDKAVLDLLKIPNLREVYLFQTKTSADVIKAIQDYKPSLKIMVEEGPYQ